MRLTPLEIQTLHASEQNAEHAKRLINEAIDSLDGDASEVAAELMSISDRAVEAIRKTQAEGKTPSPAIAAVLFGVSKLLEFVIAREREI